MERGKGGEEGGSARDIRFTRLTAIKRPTNYPVKHAFHSPLPPLFSLLFMLDYKLSAYLEKRTYYVFEDCFSSLSRIVPSEESIMDGVWEWLTRRSKNLCDIWLMILLGYKYLDVYRNLIQISVVIGIRSSCFWINFNQKLEFCKIDILWRYLIFMNGLRIQNFLWINVVQKLKFKLQVVVKNYRNWIPILVK